METQKNKELVLAIVNKGNTDLVREAARKAGSRGGTITGARGTANPKLVEAYGISIQPEKEIAFIVVDSEIKDKVRKQIYEDAGLSTKGRGIVLSLPIIDSVGLLPSEEEKE